MIELALWGLVTFLLLLIPMGFNRAQFRSRHPWISLLDGTVFTVALSQVLWLWVLQPIAHRAGLPGPERVGVLLVFGIASAALGITLHIMAKRESMGGPMGAFAAALVWIMAILPWWVKMNFLQELRPAHPFRMVMLGGFLLLWLAVRSPWPAAPIKRSTRPWIMNLLPYVPAGFAFLGAFLHELYFPTGHDRLNASLLGGLAILVLLRQVVAFREIWAIKQSLEEKVEARTRELAETSRLLLQTQRMNFIATLGAGMAHDLNNLLGAALLNMDLLESEPPYPEACGQRSRETLRTTLSRAGQLTRRLMTYGAEEPGHDSTVELAAHLRGLHPMLRALVPRSLNLDITCDAEALLVPCTPGLIDQVVVNLVVNARDATPPGGSISVKVETVSDASEKQDWACLSVVDTGTGIPQENLTRIFEPFFSTKETGKGTGLGLGSVKAVVEGLGGNIQVHSVMGQGSRFIVQLPKVPLTPVR